MELTLDMFPVLGEPLAVELANTLYERPESTIDFLARSDWIIAWLGLAAKSSPPIPKRIDASNGASIRLLRDAVRSLLTTATRPLERPDPTCIETLNRFTDSAEYCYRLDWPADRAPTALMTPTGRGFDAVLTYLGIESISFLASPARNRVRRCDGPDCPMLFVQLHHKRRFCHDGCAHRARQARYYQNHSRRPNTGVRP